MISNNKKIFIFLLLFCFTVHSFSQNVVVVGQVTTKEGPSTFSNLLIVNKRTHNGKFGKPDGSFIINAKLKDTLLIASLGYTTYVLPLPSSSPGDTIRVHVELEMPVIKLKSVRIIPKKDLDEITKEIQQLGYNKKDYLPSTINAIQSPITYLYMLYGKRPRDKRKALKAKNDDKRRALLKDLLTKYVDADIIDLNNRQFDDFIDFANITDEQMKSLTQYQFIMLIKKKFWEYKQYILRNYH